MISIKYFAGKRRKVVKKPPVKILDDFLSPGELIKKDRYVLFGFLDFPLKMFIVTSSVKQLSCYYFCFS